MDEIISSGRAKQSKYVICVILRQTYFLHVPPTRNITSHTLKGLESRSFSQLQEKGKEFFERPVKDYKFYMMFQGLILLRWFLLGTANVKIQKQFFGDVL